MTSLLPVELYRPIVEFVQPHDWRTLVALSATSKNWNVEAQRPLYQSFDYISSATRQKLFLERVVASPHLGALVKSYKVTMNFSLGDMSENVFISLLHEALMVMPNLRAFAFRTQTSEPATQNILLDCPFQLEDFSWGCHADEERLVVFLSKQPHITNLNIDIWDQIEHPSVPPNLVPNMTSLSGRYGTIAAFLPPALSVSELEWVPDLDDPNPDSQLLATGLGRLRSLLFGGYFMRPDLSCIADYLLQLKYLELRGIQVKLFPGESMIRALTYLALSGIKSIPHLETLKISMQWVSDIPTQITSDKQPAVAVRLFKECPTLNTITMASRKHILGGADYMQWSRPPNVKVEDVAIGTISCLNIPFSFGFDE